MLSARPPRHPLPPLNSPQTQPLALLHRHVEKCGGTSLRESFVHSHCQYFGYDFHAGTRHRLTLFMTSHAAYRASPRPPNEVVNNNSRAIACVEAHSPAPDLAEMLRFGTELSLLSRARVVLALVARQPDQHYPSFFRWSHAPASRSETTQAYSARFRRWAEGVPDLQSNILAHSHRSVLAARWCCRVGTRRGQSSSLSECCHGGDAPIASVPSFEMSPSFCAKVISTAAQFDVLVPMESLSRVGLALLRRATGLELPNKRASRSPTWYTRWFKQLGANRTWAPQPPPRVAVSNWTSPSRDLAPCDWRLHAMAVARMHDM